jgi:hypothetical protein
MSDEPIRTPGEEPETVDPGTFDPQPKSETPNESTNPSTQNGVTNEDLRKQLDEANRARGKAVYELGEKNKQARELENRLSQIEGKLSSAKGSDDAKYLKEQIDLLQTELQDMKGSSEKQKFEEGKQAIIEEVLGEVPEAKDFIVAMQPDFEYATTPKGIEKWENADEALDYVRWKLSEAKKRYLAKRQPEPKNEGTQPTNPAVVKTRTPNLEELYYKTLAAGDTYGALKLKKQIASERSQK